VVAASAVGAVVPWLLRAAVDALGAGGPPGRVWQLGGWMIAAAVVGGAMRYGMREILNGVSRLVETDLRDAVFAHLLTLDAAVAARWRTGELMARLTNDLGAVRMAAGPAIMYLVNTVAGGAFALVFMLRIDARLTGLALLPMVGLPWVMIRLGRLVHDRFEAVQEHFGVLTTRAQENLAGTRVVRAYGQEAAEVARFDGVNAEYAERNVALARLNGIMNPAFGLLAGVGAAVVLGVGGSLTLEGRITVGAFVAFGLYLAMLTWPLIALGWVTNLFQRGAASMARITELLDARPLLAPAAAPRPLPPRAPGRPGRTLEFRDVGFRYPTRAPGGAATGPTGATAGAGCSATSPSPCPRAPRSAWWGPWGAARARSSSSCRACSTRRRARCCSTASRCAPSTSTRSAPRWASCRRRASCSVRRSRRTSPTASPTTRTAACPRGSRRRRPAPSSRPGATWSRGPPTSRTSPRR
jgi:ATP-binding cassette subfamily B protein